MKLKPMQMADCWDTKWAFIKIFHRITFKPHGI